MKKLLTLIMMCSVMFMALSTFSKTSYAETINVVYSDYMDFVDNMKNSSDIDIYRKSGYINYLPTTYNGYYQCLFFEKEKLTEIQDNSTSTTLIFSPSTNGYLMQYNTSSSVLSIYELPNLSSHIFYSSEFAGNSELEPVIANIAMPSTFTSRFQTVDEGSLLYEIKSQYILFPQAESALQTIVNYIINNNIQFNDYLIYRDTTEDPTKIKVLLFPDDVDYYHWTKINNKYNVFLSQNNRNNSIGIEINLGSTSPNRFTPVISGDTLEVLGQANTLYYWSDNMIDNEENNLNQNLYNLMTSTPTYITPITEVVGTYNDRVNTSLKLILGYQGNYTFTIYDSLTKKSVKTLLYDTGDNFPLQIYVSSDFFNTLEKNREYTINVYDDYRKVAIYIKTFTISTTTSKGMDVYSPIQDKEYVETPNIGYNIWGWDIATNFDFYINNKYLATRSATEKTMINIEIPKYANNTYTVLGLNKLTIKNKATGEVLKEITFYIERFTAFISTTVNPETGETNIKEPTIPVPPDSSWDLLGFVRYAVEGVLYIIAYATYMIVSLISGVGALIQITASAFSFLPAPIIAIINLSIIIVIILKIFGR